MTEILRIPLDRELGERSRWLVTVRWPATGFALGLVLIVHYVLHVSLPLNALWATLAVIFCYNGLFWILTRRLTSRNAPRETHALIIYMQLAADLVAFTMIMHFTGGLENPFAAYYVLLVLTASMLTTQRASLIYATAASIVWVALLLCEAGGVIPHYNLAGYRLPGRYTEPMHVVSISLVLISLNLIVAFFISGIISRLREGERQLYDADLACELRAGELAKLNERLKELDHSRAMFIRLVTHELRAPVAAIQSYLRLILDGYVPAERFNEIITRAELRARDQLDLIADLLDLVHAQEPKAPATVTTVDASSVLMDVLDLMQVRAQAKQLGITIQAPKGLLVRAESEHIKQVWMNLVSNAIKYTPAGGKIDITVAADDGQVRGSVRDTGIGMTPEEQAMIFEPFYRTETAKQTSAQGTGLGLSIVKEIITRYSGRIWVESVKGKGSTFNFELPRSE
ncbi:MAG: HAMP domain-containing histidine kinase [Chloroflexi bacterium]|nr:HAMP domain-containing histidine kinase [Chloroflexota bacterium]